ncbi:DDE_3 domain-containing protein [Nephila pilipes]|uniref:DDE_3 domain-containing protein n=1 Tax=Nephila pilipes TaxID=299642 RepID=A0A8X6U3F5_NEPPI|nr:DDE_3 domain-containing protein [Nephila pilipes]
MGLQDGANKVVRGRSTSKQMIACFFGINSHVSSSGTEQHRQSILDNFTTICCQKSSEKFEKAEGQIIATSHDNAALTHRLKQSTFLTERIELMVIRRSPDLAPNDFFLFPHIKNKLRGQRFSTLEAVGIQNACFGVPQSVEKCFENWFKRMQSA